MAQIRMSEVTAQAGLDELAGITREEIADDFLFAAVTGLSDGDITLIHPHYDDERKAELYGEDTYNTGKVARQMLATALANRRERTPIYDFQRFAATFLTEGADLLKPGISATRIYPEAVVVDDNPLAIEHPPQVVIDYGACLTSRSHIKDQVSFANQGVRPFQYIPITNLPFMNQALFQWYDYLLGPGQSNVAQERGYYSGLEDGVKNGTTEAIEAQRNAGAETEIADIILCNTGDHLGPEQLLVGVQNAVSLLRDRGTLIIRLPEETLPNGLCADEVAQWAIDAGFSTRDVLRYEEVSHNLGTAILSGNFNPRLIKTVVLQK